jgi:glyoxylase-like metal-dependent hydrolase (beta-lactamase superfamily II)
MSLRGIATPVADGVVRIDLQFGGLEDVIAAYVIGDGDDRLLFETGPSTSLSGLYAGLDAAGIDPLQISRVAVSHIHLDHSGGAGVLLRDHPHLRLAVHPVGAPHMVNPEKLINSASRIYTDRMDELWGEIAPVDADRIDLVEDNATLTVGGRTLRARHVLGHASHHIVLFDEQNGVLFTGDNAGVRVPGSDYVGAATPPPEFDPEAWRESVEIMREFGATHVALTHGAAFADVDRHLDDVIPAIEHFIDAARATFAEGGDLEAVIEALQAVVRTGVGGDELAFRKLELADPALVSAMGLERYLRKRGEATLPA